MKYAFENGDDMPNMDSIKTETLSLLNLLKEHFVNSQDLIKDLKVGEVYLFLMDEKPLPFNAEMIFFIQYKCMECQDVHIKGFVLNNNDCKDKDCDSIAFDCLEKITKNTDPRNPIAHFEAMYDEKKHLVYELKVNKIFALKQLPVTLH